MTRYFINLKIIKKDKAKWTEIVKIYYYWKNKNIGGKKWEMN